MRAWLAAAALLLAACSAPATASAALQPLELSVEGGEQSWHAENVFGVQWSNPPGTAAVHYRVLDPGGGVAIGETVIAWPAIALQGLAIPPLPGAYTLEIWLEDALGAEGTPVSVRLRFDDRPPGRADPEPLAGWIGRASFPLALRLGRPAGPEPLAGIRGYAISIDTAPGVTPCAGTDLCSEAETDLHAGAAANTLSVADLPEGVSHLNAVAVSGSGVRSAVVASTALRVDKTDPVTRIHGVPDGWSRQPLTVTAEATDAAAGMVGDDAGPAPYTAIRIDGGTPALTAGSSATATVIGSGIHRVDCYARDAAGNVAAGGTGGEPATALVRIDREPPSLAFAAGQDPSDPELVTAHAADPLSGLDRSRGWIAVRRVGSGERFEPLPSRVSGQALQARWDSDAYPPGEYEFRAAAYDLAGNTATSALRSGGAAMRLRSPLKVATRLTAHLDRRAVPYGRGTLFGGRLLAGRRAPLAGMPVQVIERFAAGAGQRERVTTIWTGADGGFEVDLAAGPSRQVSAVSAPTATHSGARSTPSMLAVRAGVRLRISTPVARVGGRPVVFSGRVMGGAGRVMGGAMPAEGKVVELQFRLPGLAWGEFRTVRTDARGRFRYPYRFADDDSRGVRFQFRAFAPAQAGWPFEPAGSRPVHVRGI